MVLLEDSLRSEFDVVMNPLRTMGWWIELDYREQGTVKIFANFNGMNNRVYSALPAPTGFPYILADYRRWFSSCATLLAKAQREAFPSTVGRFTIQS